MRGVRYKAYKELKEKEEEEEDEDEVGKNRERNTATRENECLLAEKDRVAVMWMTSSLPFLAHPAKNRQDYTAILDVGKYPVPKESLQSGEGWHWAEK